MMRNRQVCLLAIGALLLTTHCSSHQLSISNTWTLPQDGFTVFYRFFRDKISWYEADAVCQFHHANLVTVDNGVKYDASRAFLSDLNVTENVWIGLMRSQNSDRFMWSNAKILDREFGYWAEQIPAIDAPLCAVVDPLRDYRWHSLRCGGPDVASFLCEMEAPDWASECLIRALPSLTIQYIADSATIELSRDCGAEGTKRLTCNGKQDQDLIQRELMCMSERENIAADNEMKSDDEMPAEEIDDSPQSDNMENNNIDKVANQLETSIDKVGNKFNFDEVMMGDAPVASQEADDTKPLKNGKKIASEKPLKNNPKQIRKMKAESKDDMMMGDQPADIPTAIPLHIIKEFPSTPTVVDIQQTTIEVRSRRETEIPVKANISATTTESNIKSDETHDKAVHKETPHDHFIPPMLMVQHQNVSVVPPLSDHEPNTPTTIATTMATTTSQSTQHANQTAAATTHVPTTSFNDLSTISSSIESSSTQFTASIPSTTQDPTTSTHVPSPIDFAKSNIMRPHAPKFGGDISYQSAHLQAMPKVAKDKVPDLLHVNETNPVTIAGNITETPVIPVALGNASLAIDIKPTEIAIQTTQTGNDTATVTETPHVEVAKRSNTAINTDKHHHKQQQLDSNNHTDNAKHADFTNADLDYEKYKPNRKRILTKPETHTYIQKIFG